MGDLSEHFDSSEFADPTTGEAVVDQRLVDKLEVLRGLVGKPIRVTSGYRSTAHNAAVGGASATPIKRGGEILRWDPDQHTVGKASDVTWDGIEMEDARAKARQAGFTGIGTYSDGHIHVDVRDGDLEEWDDRA